ncbi:MAG: hypothetical protein Q4C64_07815 [Erysipelotrichia bacterium]|nr:hypothetical protein [Erysipelotrichia bacterium]
MKKGILISSLLLILMVLVLILQLSHSQYKMENETNKGFIECKILNKSVSFTVECQDGDELEIKLHREKGVFDLIVKDIDNNIIYRGDNMEDCQFNIVINASGKYEIILHGRRAVGEFQWQKIESTGR